MEGQEVLAVVVLVLLVMRVLEVLELQVLCKAIMVEVYRELRRLLVQKLVLEVEVLELLEEMQHLH
jgi:hypothetical protein